MAIEDIKDELEKKFKELERYCRNNGVPCSLVYAIPGKGKAVYKQHVVTPLQANVEISPDRITPTVAMFTAGFRIVPEQRVNDNIISADEFEDDDDE